MSDLDIWALALGSAHVLLGLLAAILVSHNRKPAEAIAWVMAIVFIPFLGAAVFLLVGFGRLPAHRRTKQREVNQLMLGRTRGPWLTSHEPQWPAWLGSAAKLNESLASLPMVGGNRVTLNEHCHGTIGEMAFAVDQAAHQVHVQFYIGVLDDATAPFFEALERARARGVEGPGAAGPIGFTDAPTASADNSFPGLNRCAGASHVAPAALAWPVAASGPAQPPQDPGHRFGGGLHRADEPHRPAVTQG
ncbi:MAG: PLDc N-terminal domain-containing protein [Micrococcaceae bacterium]|nr:PLDc N-terminal domain-containing protein [Micrococcaceae bacterium]